MAGGCALNQPPVTMTGLTPTPASWFAYCGKHDGVACDLDTRLARPLAIPTQLLTAGVTTRSNDGKAAMPSRG